MTARKTDPNRIVYYTGKLNHVAIIDCTYDSGIKIKVSHNNDYSMSTLLFIDAKGSTSYPSAC